MKVRSALIGAGICALTFAGIGLAQAAAPAWVLHCDSENGCYYLSDGFGQENSGNPKANYPNKLDLTKLEIILGNDDPNKCTWQWRYIGGKWQWVCIRADQKLK